MLLVNLIMIIYYQNGFIVYALSIMESDLYMDYGDQVMKMFQVIVLR